MPTQCSAEQLEFSCVERRRVVVAFDGGTVSSDAGALLLAAVSENNTTGSAPRTGEATLPVFRETHSAPLNPPMYSSASPSASRSSSSIWSTPRAARCAPTPAV